MHPYSLFDVIFFSVITFYFYRTHGKLIGSLSAFLIIVLIGASSVYWNIYERPVSIFDLYLLKELFYLESVPSYVLFMTLSFLIISISLALYLVSLFIYSEKYKAIIIIVILISSSVISFGREDWNPLRNYNDNGLVMTLIGDFSIKAYFQFSHDGKYDSPYYLENMLDLDLDKRNINLIILESLFFPDDYDFTSFTKKGIFPVKVKTSVYAGESARSEFEALCGVRSLKQPIIEFNSIKANINCLPRLLQRKGFNTYSTNANRPWMYNASKAYNFIGIGKQNWPVTFTKEIFSDFPGGYLFDGELENYNSSQVSDFAKPYFNYVVGAYGHFPYDRDQIRRPNVLSSDNLDLENLLNISLYREEVILSFFENIQYKDDLTILCGDHQPHIRNLDYYADDKFFTYCFSNINDFNISSIFDIPSIIVGELSGQTTWDYEIKDSEQKEYIKLLY